jgi:hypothetical protein
MKHSTKENQTVKSISVSRIGIYFILAAIILLIIGAFLDLQFSKIVAGTDNTKWATSFGQYFSFLPGTLCSFLVAFVMCAVILCQPWVFVHRFYKITYYIVAYVLLGAAVWYQCFDGGVREMYYSFTNDHNFNMNTDHLSLLYSFLMAVGFMSTSSLIIIFKCKKHHIHLFKW